MKGLAGGRAGRAARPGRSPLQPAPLYTALSVIRRAPAGPDVRRDRRTGAGERQQETGEETARQTVRGDSEAAERRQRGSREETARQPRGDSDVRCAAAVVPSVVQCSDSLYPAPTPHRHHAPSIHIHTTRSFRQNRSDTLHAVFSIKVFFKGQIFH